MCSPCITWIQPFCTKTCHPADVGGIAGSNKKPVKEFKDLHPIYAPKDIDLFPPLLLELRAGKRSNDTLS